MRHFRLTQSSIERSLFVVVLLLLACFIIAFTSHQQDQRTFSIVRIDQTATPSPVSSPTIAVVPTGVPIRYSYYQPWRGGANCAHFVSGQCVSKMASGLAWQDYVERAAACPREMPFGTRIILDGQEWVCLDRGGKIVYKDGIPWIDFLTANPQYPYGSIVLAQIIYP